MKPPTMVTVRRVIGVEGRVCSLGEAHKVSIYAEKNLWLTDEIRINEVMGGYSDSQRENPVYRDAQDRRYDTVYAVDYYAVVRYIRREDKTEWRSGMHIDTPNERFDEVTT
jgi:hypothetical protein